jgi:hypothetical protein
MNHIKEYEDLMSDLRSMGYESVGYGFCGKCKIPGDKLPTMPVAWIVKGENEKDCIKRMQPFFDFLGLVTDVWDLPGGVTNMDTVLNFLYERGLIDDAGRYGPYETKGGNGFTLLTDSYQMNILYVTKLMHESFRITDKEIKEFGIPREVK